MRSGVSLLEARSRCATRKRETSLSTEQPRGQATAAEQFACGNLPSINYTPSCRNTSRNTSRLKQQYLGCTRTHVYTRGTPGCGTKASTCMLAVKMQPLLQQKFSNASARGWTVTPVGLIPAIVSAQGHGLPSNAKDLAHDTMVGSPQDLELGTAHFLGRGKEKMRWDQGVQCFRRLLFTGSDTA